ncbi:hypothetical protein [Planctobacterium marinum]|uniref:Uncharacterized protein n=1 Tax=Planctobacterium marinum TaxID=1631968 RepID=A0AA48HX64_9ALTE|nr:hypothetical protein MACH26_30340 [Planctobacterium marinum]
MDSELAFFKLKAKEICNESFERWLYANTDIESALGENDYLDLISLDYQKQSSLYEATKILETHFSLAKYYDWYIRRLLEHIINRSNKAQFHIAECYELYCDGFDFLDNLGLGYGLGLTCPDDYNESIEDYYPEIIKEAEKVLGWLNDAKIVITGHTGDYQGIEYDDRRTDEEKEPCSGQ